MSLKEQVAHIRSWLCIKDVAFAGIALAVNYQIREGEGYAATDGQDIILYAPQYFELPLRQQAGVLVHEILHIALRHVQIAHRQHYNWELFNIAADAVVNEMIARTDYLQLPQSNGQDEGVRLATLIPNHLHKIELNCWSAELVYHLLQQNNISPSSSYCLSEDLYPPKKEESEMEDYLWEQRLQRARAQGYGTSSLTEHLAGGFPKAQVPWYRMLRRCLRQATLPHTEDSYARPSRASLSVKPLFIPGAQPKRDLSDMAVIVDTSASIDRESLKYFCAEVNSLHRRGIRLTLVYADCQVQGIYPIPRQSNFLEEYQHGRYPISGRGGTNLVVPILEVKKKGFRTTVILTDGHTPFPTKSQSRRLNLIWVITTEIKAPIGKTINVRP